MSGHVEFPELMPEARAAFDRGYEANELFVSTPGKGDRVRFAAFLREATKQARRACLNGQCANMRDELEAIAANLHNHLPPPPPPPPPPPNLAQALGADLDTYAGRHLVRVFLATLREEVQP